jgi:hypothetical protein
MRILRLKLEKWRGVESRVLDFAEGVTLIEGPNEIGKSTIVEAIQNVFDVMDSSLKASVKAIQPVGQDVGSSVEIEVEVGDFHFVYAKTYNKDKGTVLHVSKPRAEQLTGREAHERVEQILKSSVDMELWNALLVEQGNEIAGVTLSQSDWLAKALDAAAGSESPEQDDSDLFARVQAEFAQHFTRTGKSKHKGLASGVDDARAAAGAATEALLQVESDSKHHKGCQAEIRRLEGVLPELQKEEQEQGAKFQAICKIRDKSKGKQGELKSAQALSKAAGKELSRRKGLIKSVSDAGQELKVAREKLAPWAGRLATLKASADAALTKLNAAKVTLKRTRAVAELTNADSKYLERAAEAASAKKKLQQLQLFSANLATARQALQGAKIDPAGLEALRDAERELQMARARLGTAMSSVEIAAEDKLQVIFNDDAPLALNAGATERRDFSSDLRVAIPGVASIRISPSRSATELETGVDECKSDRDQLLAKLGVKDLADAVAVEAKRASGQREAKSWSEKIGELLGSDTAEDLNDNVERLDSLCKGYLAKRAPEPALPDSLAQAMAASSASVKAVAVCEEEFEAQQAAWEVLRKRHIGASAEQSVSEKETGGQEKFVNLRKQELAESRVNESDEAIERRVEGESAKVCKLEKGLDHLDGQLESSSPDAAELNFTNAQADRQRAAAALETAKTQRAVLEDRLSRAQADGRFEARDAASNKLVALEAESKATLGRASAAQHLWTVLNHHRDTMRKAYGRPLKLGVEELGKIVFGPDFAIEIGDDLSLKSRTQGGKTIPFHDLSVGAKEQLGILMRLAAARIISSQGGVPLIIDDALGFADPSRLESMGAAIARAGEDCQIILLSCTPGRFKSVGCDKIVKL